MATSGYRSDEREDDVECLMKFPLEYLNETKEYICGLCGQTLIANHTTADLETHFKSCKTSREDVLPLLFKELRNVNQKLEMMNVDVSEIKKKVDTVKSEVMEETIAKLLDIKTEVAKEMESHKAEFKKEMLSFKSEIKKELEIKCGKEGDGDLPTLFGIVKVLEDGMKEKMDQLKSNDLDLQVLKRQMENGQAKNESTKKPSFHVEPSPFNQLTIPMNGFNLITHNYLFQPSFRWTIDGITAKLSQKTFELTSEMFQWNGYPVQVRAKLQLKEDNYFYMSFALNDGMKDEDEPKDFKTTPLVYYLLKDKKSSLRHVCKLAGYLLGTVFKYVLPFHQLFVRKSWFDHAAYNVDDSVEIEIYVEPSPMTQLVHSYDGTLEWNIENYAKRLQFDKDGLVIIQESPYFYTAPNGYRVQVEIFLKGFEGKGLTARILFLTGRFDAELPESFLHSTTVTLINRKDPERNISKTIVENIQNKKYYDLEMCKLDEVEQLVENDALFCKVSIESH